MQKNEILHGMAGAYAGFSYCWTQILQEFFDVFVWFIRTLFVADNDLQAIMPDFKEPKALVGFQAHQLAYVEFF